MFRFMQMIFTHANNFKEALIILTSTMTNVQDWLTKSDLLLNTKTNCVGCLQNNL